MPISTRLYSPADFSAAAVFAALVGILSVSACLRFDMAIAIPDDESEAADLLLLSILSAIAMTGLTAFALIILPTSWLAKLGQPRVLPWLWLVPLGVLIGGAYLSLQMWFVRRSGFRAIASSRIAQSASASTAQVLFGLARKAPLGLMIGQLLNIGAGAIWLGISVLVRDWPILRRVTVSRMAHTFVKYRRFPVYSTWEALANASSTQVPILLIAALATGPEPGYLTLAIFLLQTPMALLGTAIAQVYLAEAPTAFNEGRLKEYTLRSLRASARAAAAPMIIIGLVSPAAFDLVFGHQWTRAGILVTWMVPWFYAQFLTSPISGALHVLGRQRAAMVLQVCGLVLRSGGVLVAAGLIPIMISETYALTGFVFYGIYLATIAKMLRLTWSDLAAALSPALPLAVSGAGIGLLAVGVLSLIRAT
jgi:O-antigen/teichoic acid export membrane protein